ncbi:MAG: YdcF family protein [Prochlorotrichaceae cyanobacterium]
MVLLLLLVILSPLWIEVPMMLLLRFLFTEYAGESADAIVILGRGLQHRSTRIEGAFYLWDEQPDLDIFVSGMNDAVEITTVLADGGIPAAQIQGERCSQSTIENAEFTSLLLSPKGIQKIILVSDRAHLVRASLVFLSYGFEVLPYAVPTVQKQEFSYEKVLVNLREDLGLVYAGLRQQFQPKSATDIQAAQQKSSLILEDWNCQVVLTPTMN